MDGVKLDRDPKVHVLDITSDLLNTDGTIKPELFAPDKIHLSQDAGYSLYAERLSPLVEKLLGGKGMGGAVAIPNSAHAAIPAAATNSVAGLKQQYLLLNYVANLNAPGQSAEIMTYVQEKFGFQTELRP